VKTVTCPGAGALPAICVAQFGSRLNYGWREGLWTAEDVRKRWSLLFCRALNRSRRRSSSVRHQKRQGLDGCRRRRRGLVRATRLSSGTPVSFWSCCYAWPAWPYAAESSCAYEASPSAQSVGGWSCCSHRQHHLALGRA